MFSVLKCAIYTANHNRLFYWNGGRIIDGIVRRVYLFPVIMTACHIRIIFNIDVPLINKKKTTLFITIRLLKHETRRFANKKKNTDGPNIGQNSG